MNPANISFSIRQSWKFIFHSRVLALALLLPNLALAQIQPVTVTLAKNAGETGLSPCFLGLSYETSMLLPKDGRYYFDAHDQALVNTFKTLGIKSLRVGANAVDDPRVPVPQEKDIDALFNFARAAGVKVIYSFRLKNGNPAESARLARYIADHYADVLDCFSIGNEPNFYLKTFPTFFAQWKSRYDAIRQSVPDAKFDGPSADGSYALALADALFAGGHLAMASDHYYFLGFGRVAEKNPATARDHFLANKLHAIYEKDYAKVGAVLAARGVPYRIDELNNCCDGGAKDASDTYTASLWALDCTHWWAAHHILGVNYHTGELVGRDGKFGPPNYAAFLRQVDGPGYVLRPQGYAFLAFSQGARGMPLDLAVQASTNFDFSAYAYQDGDGSIYLTLINKSHDAAAQSASVSLRLPRGADSGAWQRLDLVQKDMNVAAKSGVSLGGAEVDAQGMWTGRWKRVPDGKAGSLAVQVPAASAAILHFLPAKRMVWNRP
jgi:hypothetical protein